MNVFTGYIDSAESFGANGSGAVGIACGVGSDCAERLLRRRRLLLDRVRRGPVRRLLGRGRRRRRRHVQALHRPGVRRRQRLHQTDTCQSGVCAGGEPGELPRRADACHAPGVCRPRRASAPPAGARRDAVLDSALALAGVCGPSTTADRGQRRLQRASTRARQRRRAPRARAAISSSGGASIGSGGGAGGAILAGRRDGAGGASAAAQARAAQTVRVEAPRRAPARRRRGAPDRAAAAGGSGRLHARARSAIAGAASCSGCSSRSPRWCGRAPVDPQPARALACASLASRPRALRRGGLAPSSSGGGEVSGGQVGSGGFGGASASAFTSTFTFTSRSRHVAPSLLARAAASADRARAGCGASLQQHRARAVVRHDRRG